MTEVCVRYSFGRCTQNGESGSPAEEWEVRDRPELVETHFSRGHESHGNVVIHSGLILGYLEKQVYFPNFQDGWNLVVAYIPDLSPTQDFTCDPECSERFAPRGRKTVAGRQHFGMFDWHRTPLGSPKEWCPAYL